MNQPQDLYQEVRAGGDIKSFLLNLHRRNTGELEALDPIMIDTDKIVAMPTVLVPSIAPARSIAAILPHQFYVDAERHQVLKLDDLMADTLDLVSEAVTRFRTETGAYPDEIIPCPSRFLLLQFGHFCPTIGVLIPFTRDFIFPIDYDVIVRGRVHGY
jgi:hypothetical protein